MFNNKKITFIYLDEGYSKERRNNYEIICICKKQIRGGDGEVRTLARFIAAYSLSRGAPLATWVRLQMKSDYCELAITHGVSFNFSMTINYVLIWHDDITVQK